MGMGSSHRKVRLLIVANNLDRGGLEEVVLMYAKFLDKSRYRIAVAHRGKGIVSSEIALIEGVEVFCYDSPGKWKRFVALWHFARTFNPDIVHNHFSWYGLILGLIVHAARVETIHNTYHWFPRGQRVAYGLYCLAASRLIAVSGHVRDFTIEFFPFMRRKKITLVHNGIDTGRFQVPADDRQRAEAGILANVLVIGFIGRLEMQKGITHLLHAVAELNKDVHNLKVLVAGEGSLANELKNEAASLRLGNVHFLGFRRDTPQLFRLFDVFVLPSLFEGLPVVLIEAMAAGCAVVTTRIGGVDEVVTDGVNGIIVPPADPSALALALRRVVSDAALRKRLGDAAREHASESFSAQAMIKHTEDVYSQLVPHLYEP